MSSECETSVKQIAGECSKRLSARHDVVSILQRGLLRAQYAEPALFCVVNQATFVRARWRIHNAHIDVFICGGVREALAAASNAGTATTALVSECEYLSGNGRVAQTLIAKARIVTSMHRARKDSALDFRYRTLPYDLLRRLEAMLTQPGSSAMLALHELIRVCVEAHVGASYANGAVDELVRRLRQINPTAADLLDRILDIVPSNLYANLRIIQSFVEITVGAESTEEETVFVESSPALDGLRRRLSGSASRLRDEKVASMERARDAYLRYLAEKTKTPEFSLHTTA
ncbi:MAG TPA: hypothetical protein VFL13_01535 [Candidatus Baltobacteraceae bacterium]|nr:hypothetical protein [Candidatus Baltobacteraceae bacterium]